MPVLKSETSRRLMKDAIVLDLGDLNREAKRIIERAQEEASAITEKARREAEDLVAGAAEAGRAQGMEKGLKEGRDLGREEGRREAIGALRPRLDATLESWNEALAQWENDRADMLLAARQDVLTFALEMGRRLTLRALEVDPGAVVDQVAEALSHLTRPTAVKIAVHPDDRSLVEEALPALLSRFAQCEEATLEEDASMMRGGCVVKTGRGEIDASIEAQIDRIVSALLPGRAAEDESEAGKP